MDWRSRRRNRRSWISRGPVQNLSRNEHFCTTSGAFDRGFAAIVRNPNLSATARTDDPSITAGSFRSVRHKAPLLERSFPELAAPNKINCQDREDGHQNPQQTGMHMESVWLGVVLVYCRTGCFATRPQPHGQDDSRGRLGGSSRASTPVFCWKVSELPL